MYVNTCQKIASGTRKLHFSFFAWYYLLEYDKWYDASLSCKMQAMQAHLDSIKAIRLQTQYRRSTSETKTDYVHETITEQTWISDPKRERKRERRGRKISKSWILFLRRRTRKIRWPDDQDTIGFKWLCTLRSVERQCLSMKLRTTSAAFFFYTWPTFF